MKIPEEQGYVQEAWDDYYKTFKSFIIIILRNIKIIFVVFSVCVIVVSEIVFFVWKS